MKKAYFYSILSACILLIVVMGYFCWFTPVTTVILVRHAEKATTPPDDPALTNAGMRRADTLAHDVGEPGIEVIFVTEFRRTQQTAAPTAAALGLTPVALPATEINEVVDRINSDHRGEVILVVEHSNTIPAIIQRLGISPTPVIAENEFDNLFVVTIHHFGSATLTHLKYGSST